VVPAGRYALKRTSRVVHCYTINSFAKKSDDVESLQFFTPFMPPVISSVSVMSLMTPSRNIIGGIFNSN
jgi:hypothetical protein